MPSDTIQSVELESAYRLLNFGPVVLLSTTDGVRANVCTVAWCTPLNKKPPRFGIALGHSHLSFANIQANPVVGINIPTAALRDLVMYCGSVSGREVDKVESAHLKLRAGSVIHSVPLLDDCAAWLECRVTDAAVAGDLLVVEAFGASCRRGVLNQKQQWDVVAYPTLHHLGGDTFAVADQIVQGNSDRALDS